MSLWRSLKWSTAGVFLLLIAVATYAAAISERDFFGDYPLVALSQGWVALVAVGPLLAGWGAWDTARITPWLDATFSGSHRGKALSRLTAPALLIGVLLPTAIVIYVAGWPEGPTTALIVLAAGATMIAAASIGSAIGCVLPRLAAVPVAAATAYGVLALGVADPSSAIGRVTLTGLVAPCCNSTEQISPRALVLAALLALLVAGGSLITLAVPRRRRSRATALVVTILATVAAGHLVAQNISADEKLPARTTATQCRDTAEVQVCVWPEHTRELDQAAAVVAQARDAATALGLKTPTQWSEDPTAGQATFMWTNALTEEDHRYAVGIDIAHQLGCTGIGQDVPVGMLFADKMGGAPTYLTQRGSGTEAQFKEITSMTPSQQSQWLAGHVDTCRA